MKDTYANVVWQLQQALVQVHSLREILQALKDECWSPAPLRWHIPNHLRERVDQALEAQSEA